MDAFFDLVGEDTDGDADPDGDAGVDGGLGDAHGDRDDPDEGAGPAGEVGVGWWG